MGTRALELLDKLNESENGIINISNEDILPAVELESYQRAKVKTKGNRWFLIKNHQK